MPRLLLSFLLIAAVAACDDNPATQPSQPIVVRSEGQDRLHQLDDLNRAIALKRAIYESGNECRRVTQSGYVGEYENTSYWTATCEDRFGRTRDWALFVGPDESVQVRLCEDVVKAGLQACTIKPGAKAPGDQSG
jgi:hypothetical protein